jgi:hypothetical protein
MQAQDVRFELLRVVKNFRKAISGIRFTRPQEKKQLQSLRFHSGEMIRALSAVLTERAGILSQKSPAKKAPVKKTPAKKVPAKKVPKKK